jgi:hypothetical protein
MSKNDKWAFLDELDEPIEKPSGNRDYIDSYEENKNLMMALKKSADLGTDFEIPLEDGTTMVIPEDTALNSIDYLMTLKPDDRESFTKEMGKSQQGFVIGLRKALSA